MINVNSRKKSRHQARRHELINATGCHRLRQRSSREIQHRKGYRRIHKKRIRQEVQSHLALCRRQKFRFLRDP